MSPRRLTRDVLLSVTLDAICSRNRYTGDPGSVIEELHAAAGDRLDILTESVGTWVGFFESAHTMTLCAALRELPGVAPWIGVGIDRRGQRDHGTPCAHAGASWPERQEVRAIKCWPLESVDQ